MCSWPQSQEMVATLILGMTRRRFSSYNLFNLITGCEFPGTNTFRSLSDEQERANRIISCALSNVQLCSTGSSFFIKFHRSCWVESGERLGAGKKGRYSTINHNERRNLIAHPTPGSGENNAHLFSSLGLIIFHSIMKKEDFNIFISDNLSRSLGRRRLPTSVHKS